MRERWGSLISGGGTTMEAITRACQSGEVPMDAAGVISSDPNAGGIEKAEKLGILHEIVNPDDYKGEDGKVDQEGFGQAILRILKKWGVTVVTQNGWIPLTPEPVISEFEYAIFNQHPGPKKETGRTRGIQPHAIILYIARHTGRNEGTEVVVHRVTPRFDEGPTVGVTPVEIYLPHDFPKRLQRRALPIEHELQIRLLKQVARGDVKEVISRKQYIRPGEENILSAARKYARQRYPNG